MRPCLLHWPQCFRNHLALSPGNSIKRSLFWVSGMYNNTSSIARRGPREVSFACFWIIYTRISTVFFAKWDYAVRINYCNCCYCCCERVLLRNIIDLFLTLVVNRIYYAECDFIYSICRDESDFVLMCCKYGFRSVNNLYRRWRTLR